MINIPYNEFFHTAVSVASRVFLVNEQSLSHSVKLIGVFLVSLFRKILICKYIYL